MESLSMTVSPLPPLVNPPISAPFNVHLSRWKIKLVLTQNLLYSSYASG